MTTKEKAMHRMVRPEWAKWSLSPDRRPIFAPPDIGGVSETTVRIAGKSPNAHVRNLGKRHRRRRPYSAFLKSVSGVGWGGGLLPQPPPFPVEISRESGKAAEMASGISGRSRVSARSFRGGGALKHPRYRTRAAPVPAVNIQRFEKRSLYREIRDASTVKNHPPAE